MHAHNAPPTGGTYGVGCYFTHDQPYSASCSTCNIDNRSTPSQGTIVVPRNNLPPPPPRGEECPLGYDNCKLSVHLPPSLFSFLRSLPSLIPPFFILRVFPSLLPSFYIPSFLPSFPFLSFIDTLHKSIAQNALLSDAFFPTVNGTGSRNR
jgi:hypothetical protein